MRLPCSLLVGSLLSLACSGPPGVDGGPADAGAAPLDAGAAAPDGGSDGGFDAGPELTGSASLFASGLSAVISVTLTAASAAPQLTTTAADGAFSFDAVPVGPYALAFSEAVSLPGWLPDGGSVEVSYGALLPNAAALSRDGGLAPVTLFPGQLVELAESGGPIVAAPNGETLWVQGGANDFLLALDGGAPDAGTAVFPATPTQASSFSPDGQWFALLSGGTLVLQSAPSGLPYIQIAEDVAQYQFSADSREVALLADGGDGGAELEVAPILFGAPQPASVYAAGISSFLFAPAGGTLAFVTDASADAGPSLELAQPEVSASPRIVATFETAPLDWFDFSTDGALLTFESGGVLQAVPASGGSPVTLATDVFASPQISPAVPTFSPDGRTLAFETGAADGGVLPLRLATVPVAGGPPVVVAGSVATYQFSPDGQHLAVLDPGGTLSVVPSAGGSAVTVATGVNGGFAFSPDSRTLAFGVGWTAQYAGALETAPVAGGAAPFTVTSNAAFFEFSDASHLLCLTDWDGSGGSLSVAQINGGISLPIATGVAWVQPSPDGGRLAFASYNFRGAFGVLGVARSDTATSLLLMDNLPMPTGGAAERPSFVQDPPSWTPQWISRRLLVGLRQGSGPPYDVAQDGVYAFAIP
ncbi:MAG: WD40 repeat domain-containing protein [Myxococcales bacterium]